MFINRCLRSILKKLWSDKVTNVELWRRAGQRPIKSDLRRRRWRWVGHTLRRHKESITRQALYWNPQGKRSRGRPRNTWRRESEMEKKRAKLTWKVLPRTGGPGRVWLQTYASRGLKGEEEEEFALVLKDHRNSPMSKSVVSMD